MSTTSHGIFIHTISGGIVNFGGALKIAPISITSGSASGSGSDSASSGQSSSGVDIIETAGMLLPHLHSGRLTKQSRLTSQG